MEAMAFFHDNGMVPAWKQAKEFAGKQGHIGTMLDVVDARIATGINDDPWNTYYTTNSAEYFGYSRGGNRILIVAHGVGPMSTLEGILKAYSFEFKDKSRNNRGGRITVEQFRDLESGKFGDVHIIDFDSIVKKYEYPFMGYLTCEMACFEPLMLARLGVKAVEYLYHHKEMAQKIHREEHYKEIADPYIVQMGNASNCFYVSGGFDGHPLCYPFLDKDDGAIGHLISTGGLANVCHENERGVPYSIANDVGLHEWSNGTRLIGIQPNAKISDIHPGFQNIGELIKKNWKSLMQKVETPVYPSTLYRIMAGKNDMLFTQYPKKGASMDTHEPEFRIKSMKTIGAPIKFKTKIGGYHMFFRYDVKEVQALKPLEANAYNIIDEITTLWENGNPTYHQATIQFYKAEIDTSQRLIRRKKLKNDFNTLMSLLEKETA